MNSQESKDQKEFATKLLEKRLQNEIILLKKDSFRTFQFVQDTENKLIFYFMFEGFQGTDFEGGKYLAKFVLAENFPIKFGKAYLLTPNDKLVIDTPLSFTFPNARDGDGGEWLPLYTIKHMMDALIVMFHDEKTGGISRISETKTNIREKAKESIQYNAEHYPEIWKKFCQKVA